MGGDPEAVLDDRVVHHRRDLGGIHRDLEELLETLVLLAWRRRGARDSFRSDSGRFRWLSKMFVRT